MATRGTAKRSGRAKRAGTAKAAGTKRRSAQRRGATRPKARKTAAPRIDFAGPARAGHLDALAKLTGSDDRLAYKWLHAAADAGHDVEQQIATLLDTSSLRDDRGGYKTAAAHWELACAYLEGSDGLPVDLELAQHHLAKAFERHDLASINAQTNSNYSPATLLLKLTGDAWKTLETALVNIPEQT